MNALKQHFTQRDAEVIADARRKRRDVIVLRRDRSWLKNHSSRPADMLAAMAARGALIKLGGGRYVIPSVGSSSVGRSTSWQAVIDAELGTLGPYYVGFMTALEEHRLTDLDEPDITVAIGFHNDRIEREAIEIAGRPLRVTTTRPPLFDFGVETVRQTRERQYRRSDLERTLIDCYDRPYMVGSTETWVRAWAEAFRKDRIDVDRLLDYSLKVGPSACRRTGVMLSLLGQGEIARDAFPARVRRADRTIPFLARSPVPPDAEIDPFWRVAFNVPRDLIDGWLAYGR